MAAAEWGMSLKKIERGFMKNSFAPTDFIYSDLPCSLMPNVFFSPCLAFFSSFLCQCTSLCCLWSPLKHCELFVRPVVNGISPPPQFVALIIGSLTLRQVHLWARQCASVNRFLNAKILLAMLRNACTRSVSTECTFGYCLQKASTTADNFLMHS